MGSGGPDVGAASPLGAAGRREWVPPQPRAQHRGQHLGYCDTSDPTPTPEL